MFRGQGIRISLAERAQYDKDIHVLYQTNVWQDNETQMKYAEEVLLPYMQQRIEDWNKKHMEQDWRRRMGSCCKTT